MRHIVICSVLVAATSVAQADPSGYTEAGVLAGATSGGAYGGLLIGAAAIDAGVRVPQTPLWIRGMAARGSNLALNETSSLRQLRLGAELHIGINRPCIENVVCAVVGADVADQKIDWQTVSWDGAPPDSMGTDHDHLLIPRVGLTMAGSRAQASVVAEMPASVDDKRPVGFDVAMMAGVHW